MPDFFAVTPRVPIGAWTEAVLKLAILAAIAYSSHHLIEKPAHSLLNRLIEKVAAEPTATKEMV